MDKRFLDDVVWHYRHPDHRGKSSGRVYRAANLSCGDQIELYLVIEKGVVKSASYSGDLCSIANYGADLLLESLIGQPLSTVEQITSVQLLDSLGASLLANPVRLKCFELAQVALQRKT
jgi:nitrogen fixation NifU-like protein